MEITLSAVADAGRARLAAVTAEVGAHVVLLAAREIAASPCHVSAASVLLAASGEVSVLLLEPASVHEAEWELRQLLAELIGLAPAAPPALKAAAERAAGGGLDALEAELHAALIPINHAAARRALARLFRETQRAIGAGATPGELTPMGERSVFTTPGASAVAARLPSRVATPAPAQSRRAEAVPQVEPLAPKGNDGAVQGELDIDVDVVEDEAHEAAPDGEEASLAEPPPVAVTGAAARRVEGTADGSPAPGAAADATGSQEPPEPLEDHVAPRSEVGDLVAGFLAHTRSEERLGEDLRRMLGLDRSAPASTRVLRALGPDAHSRR